MRNMVSIVVPVYNVEKYIKRCIESILNQTYKNIQLILIDDGSTDASGEVCDQFAKIDGRIKVIHKKNEGVSSARNYGIESCNGEYLMFVDSDDALATDIVEKAVSLMNKTLADVAVFGYKKIYESGNNQEWLPEKNLLLSGKTAVKKLLKNFSDLGGGYPNKMWRVSVFDGNIPLYNTKLFYFDDSEWMTRMLLKCKNVITLDTIGYLYYIRDNSITFRKGYDDKKELGYHQSMLAIINDLQEEKDICVWFKSKYYPEMVNGIIHAWKHKWKETKQELIKDFTQHKKEILKSNNISLNIKLRCFFIEILKIIYRN